MNHPAADGEPLDVADLQNAVVQMRYKGAQIYKKLLLKECQVKATNLAEVKINIPQQQSEALQNLLQVDRSGTGLRGPTPNRMQELYDRTRLLQQCVEQGKSNNKNPRY